MRRGLLGMIVAVIAVVGLAGPAAAQYPPTPGTAVADGRLVPGSTVNITVTCPAIVPGVTYGGDVDGAPLTPAVGGDGEATFRFDVPRDFRPARTHLVTVTADGEVVCTAVLAGTIPTPPVTAPPVAPGPAVPTPPTPPRGPLPRTGTDFTELGLRLGAAAIAAGAVALAVAGQRRRTTLRSAG